MRYAFPVAQTIAENVARVRDRIQAACARSRRSPESVALMAVSKTVDADRIQQAAEAGVKVFGENRVQEWATKRNNFRGVVPECHLIGHLQSNKASRAVEIFSTIDSVDSAALSRRLEASCAGLNRELLRVLIEVNIGREPQKAGVMPEQALELAETISGLSRLRLMGVMAVPPLSENPENSRWYFAEVRGVSERLREVCRRSKTDSATWQLSMGMSHDFEVAIEEGATVVRIGTLIFGARA